MSGVRQFSRQTICRPGDIYKRFSGGIALFIALTYAGAALAEEQEQAAPAIPPATESRSEPGATALNPATGRLEWLGTDQDKFLTIFTEATAPAPLGTAIILPGIGTHPDWPGIINTLRAELPRMGWSTLSIQPPEAPNAVDEMENIDARFDLAQTRIQASIKYCQDQGIRNIALIGHGLGAAMAASYLANTKESGITAFVGIGMHKPSRASSERYKPELLQQIILPMLDMYGHRDLDEVKAEAEARAVAARKRNGGNSPVRDSAPVYRQSAIVGADHFFLGFEQDLARRVGGWLKRHAAASRANILPGALR